LARVVLGWPLEARVFPERRKSLSARRTLDTLKVKYAAPHHVESPFRISGILHQWIRRTRMKSRQLDLSWFFSKIQLTKFKLKLFEPVATPPDSEL
jgi:hypothetical protein